MVSVNAFVTFLTLITFVTRVVILRSKVESDASDEGRKSKVESRRSKVQSAVQGVADSGRCAKTEDNQRDRKKY